MSDSMCGYPGDRDAALMSYLYDEITAAERAAFETHVGACAQCRTELAAFEGIRRQLARWSPPEFASLNRSDGEVVAGGSSRSRQWWRDIPAWAQVAAAMLFLGVAAGIANLDVHYDARGGLNVRTGWSRTPTVAQGSSNVAQGSSNVAQGFSPANSPTPPWRAELTALEQQLRSEMHAGPSAAVPGAARAAVPADADLMRRVKALVDDSERRQQRELALRVTALLQDLNAQRQADLRKIDQNLGLIQDRTGVEVLRNRQMIDYYMQRVSQRP